MRGKLPEVRREGPPLTGIEGKLSKKQMKKLSRIHASQVKKYNKFLETRGKSPPGAAGVVDVVGEGKKETAERNGAGVDEAICNPEGGVAIVPQDPKAEAAIKVIHGSFGGRQAFTLTSEMGPFSHVLDF